MAENEPKPLRLFRANNEYVSRANSIQWCDADLVEVGTQLAEQDFATPELELVAFEFASVPPFGKRDAPARHVFEGDVGCSRFEFVGLDTSARILCEFAQRAFVPPSGQAVSGCLHELGFEEALGQRLKRLVHPPV